MRLVATFNSKENAETFSHYLKVHHIDCQIEDHGKKVEVWVLDEDKVAHAKEYLEKYATADAEPLSPPKKKKMRYGRLRLGNKAPWTRLCILACVFIYFTSLFQLKELFKEENRRFIFPVLSPIQQVLIYDYPDSLKKAMEFTLDYPITDETKFQDLPPEGRKLYLDVENNPPWPGLYGMIVNERGGDQPLFTSIRNFEVWRTITPIFLHANLLHILFNMLWLWLFGKMMEVNLSGLRYLSFIMITAIITNTLQYLMTGPLFMGFSGVICAMGGYIWERKRVAPWEIYLIDKNTFRFLALFIFGMLTLQMIAFFLQILHIASLPIQIANTAHISGLILGVVMGRVPLFQRTV